MAEIKTTTLIEKSELADTETVTSYLVTAKSGDNEVVRRMPIEDIDYGLDTVTTGKCFLIKDYTINDDGKSSTFTLISEGNVTDNGNKYYKTTHSNKATELALHHNVPFNGSVTSLLKEVVYDNTNKNKGDYISCRIDYNHNHFGMVTAVDPNSCTITINSIIKPAGNDETILDSNKLEGATTCPADYGASLWIVGKPELGTCPMDKLEFDEDPMNAFAAGINTKATNIASTAFGKNSVADGKYGTATGKGSWAGYAAFASGTTTKAAGNSSTAVGHNTTAYGSNSVAAGQGSTVYSGSAMVHGYYNKAGGRGFKLEQCVADDTNNVVKFTISSTAQDYLSTHNGTITIVSNYTYPKVAHGTDGTDGLCWYLEDGKLVIKNPPNNDFKLSGNSDKNAEYFDIFIIDSCPEIGEKDVGACTVSFGCNNNTPLYGQFATGCLNTVYGKHGIVGGKNNKAGFCGHVSGHNNDAYGDYHFAHGKNLITTGMPECGVAFGKFNSKTNLDKYIFVVGYGTHDLNRSTKFAIDKSGNIYYGSKISALSASNEDGLVSLDDVVTTLANQVADLEERVAELESKLNS